MAVKKFSTDSSIKNSFKLSRGATSAAKPEAPTIGAVAAGATPSTQVTVAYTAATLGAAASTFTATSTPSSLTGTGSSPITVSGLSPSTSYTFTVKASNANGDSPASAASSSITTSVNPTAFDSIETFVVGSGGSASITFSSIPATYKHLQIRCLMRGTTSSNTVDILMRFNGDTSSKYTGTQLYGDGSGTAAHAGLAGGVAGINAYPFYTMADTGAANTFGPGVLDIIDYTNTSKYKVWKSLEGYEASGTDGLILLRQGSYIDTTAISSISLTPDAGSFKENSRFALYGIRG